LREEVSDSTLLNAVSSPQQKAFNFVVNEADPVCHLEEKRIIQRYTMALLFYSTGGETTWTRCTPDISNTNCVGNPNLAGQLIASQLGTEDYLSSEHECSWGGVLCNSDDCITEIHLRK